jgi:hypothetical protein
LYNSPINKHKNLSLKAGVISDSFGKIPFLRKPIKRSKAKSSLGW